MDTPMLDVAIGLVMVFAVASLLATELQELLASWRNSRGANLKEAIASMGGDDPQVAEAIYSHPLVQSLFMVKRGGPAYLPADVFSTALLSVLAKGSAIGLRQGTPREYLSALTPQAGDPKGFEPLRESLEALVAGVENDWPAFEGRVQAWFSHTGERSIGWFKRDTQRNLMLIGIVIAVGINVDAIRIGNTLWNDKAVRERGVERAIKLDQARTGNAATARPDNTSPTPPAAAPAAAPATAPADADKLTAAQEATTKQLTQLVNDLQQFGKLAAPALKPLGQAQETAARRLQASITSERTMNGLPGHDAAQLAVLLRQNDANLHSLHAALAAAPPAKASSKEQDALRTLQDKVAMVEAFLQNERSNRSVAVKPPPPSETTAQPCAVLSGKAKALCEQQCGGMKDKDLALCETVSQLDALSEAGIPLGWNDGQLAALYQAGTAAMLQAALGWLITAVAISLGAPFWFDLLSKLVKLRGSGAKADGAQAAADTPPPSVTAPATPAPAAPGTPSFSDAQNDDEQKLTMPEVAAIQMALGMSNAQISGRLDTGTRSLISAWQLQQGIQGTGVLSASQIQSLLYGKQPTTSQGNPAAQAPFTFHEG